MKIEVNNKDQAEPITGEAWATFIENELNATREAYLAKPAFLLGHSRSERQTTADYAGRELLELVQNAADAAAEVGGSGKVLIEVTPDCLYVANSGQPFRTGGVSSLMTAHTSDKPSRAARMIGAKGLGFRAILNWTEAPLINSGELEIGFSRSHAAAQVAALARQNPEIAKQRAGTKTDPLPLLVFPAAGDELEVQQDPGTSVVLDHVRALRGEGYDTVVAAPFRDQRAFEKAIEQALEFEPSFLLFVKALHEIRIQLPDETARDWSTVPDEEEEGDVEIRLARGSDAETQTWILRQRHGTLGSGEAARDYELAIALRRDEACEVGRLHSYFPTSLPLPFTGLFHATLELDSNRKTIQDGSELNDAVLSELGHFYAETLHELRKNGRLGSDPLVWLVAHGQFPQPLESMAQEAWRRARELPLIRGLDSAWRSAEKSLIGPAGYARFLPHRLFGELAAVEDESVENLLRDQLEVAEIAAPKMLERLRHADLEVDERARAIVGIASALPEEHHDRRLLLDTNLKSMPKGAIPFPPPSRKEQQRNLPRWSSARFIYPELWGQLVEQADGSTLRGIISSLKGFRVTEFSVESVIQALRIRLGELIKSKHPDPNRLQAEFLAELYALHDQNRHKPNGTIRVKCKDGSWQDVTLVHLSEAYGQSGRINAALYSTHPELLIADPAENGLPSEADDLADFLVWLGINRWPRQINEPLPKEWRQTVLQALPEKIMVFDGSKSQELQRDALTWGYTLEAEYETIQELSDILAEAPCEAILAWLSLDERMDALAPFPNFKVVLKGRSSANAVFRPYNDPLPDIFRQIIRRRKWLICSDGLLHAPQDAMSEPGALASLFRVPQTPNASSEIDFGLVGPLWRRGLERAGVVRGLGDIPEDQVYRMLLDLPSRGVPPEIASRFLLQLLERDAFDPETGGADRDRFLQEGKVPIHTKAGRDWGAREEAYYAHRDDLPEAARSHLTLVDLPSRRNATQVEARFGIPALRKDSMNIRLRSVEREGGPVAVALSNRFEQARPFILALRNHLSPDQSPLRRMKSLKLTVARRAEMELQIGDQTIIDYLDPFKHSLNGRDQELTVTIDPGCPDDENIDLGLHAISDGLAELFELQANSDFTSLLTAATQGLRMSHLLRSLPTLTEEELEAVKTGVGYIEASGPQIRVDSDMLSQALEKPGTAKNTVDSSPDIDLPETSEADKEDGSLENEVTASKTSLQLKATALPVSANGLTSLDDGKKTTVRITEGTGPLASRNADADRAADAEHWTVAFEISQGRFPMFVANLIGAGAFGCDCLSFATKEELETFRTDPQRIDLVARFIETKSGTVRFTPNEWEMAQDIGERYFAYRVSFLAGRRDQAHLTIVKNPSAQSEALRVSRELLVDQVASRETYDLVPFDKASSDDSDSIQAI
ncbi:MAG: hypothetical protein ABJX32_04705 [Tateyamaria sp.]|uniref:sacsin N-terminal ATP-binding-like domain-containing protein n=1 Tax=Tateyamaria sp. TaxID=1929288 RepID=UPI00329BC9E7